MTQPNFPSGYVPPDKWSEEEKTMMRGNVPDPHTLLDRLTALRAATGNTNLDPAIQALKDQIDSGEEFPLPPTPS